MRVYVSLAELQNRFARERAQRKHIQEHKYDGLEQCRKNVIKAGCAKKLKYCIARSYE